MRTRRPIQIVSLALALALSTWIAGRAAAENERTVTGSVTLPPGSGANTDTIVYLEGSLPAPTPPVGAEIDVEKNAFVPRVSAVPVGSSVQFHNSDEGLHNIFSGSPAKQFDLGVFEKGASRSVTFDKPGVIGLRCKVQTQMSGDLLVLPNSFFTRVSADGTYTLSGIPAGQYSLHAWHPGLQPAEQKLNLDDAKMRTVDIRLRH